ncbi:pentapeptide repeat-containing protein [Paraburkholderia silvatlantica]|uniref:Uncharacterized protein YjbI with pentapeptide repeats n=1 Tax=Paraburkholderia silvatlantica TaxID=321895 RepID=A0A2V4SXF8_9BURK|nr:pentapeptide repeat-containing protein [Paraburkholderia silvatlantica]PYE13163.1 uncharacterized protein YjbI with pentapeptide repeats [Paraburkholderia silvatlantica]TDQ76057.1 uncharacterized protein YjbI with pentapeptide repeats [Paraburkholderia silvatlantica]
MNELTQWSLSIANFGNLAAYNDNFGFAGGRVVVGLGDKTSPFKVIDLGNGQIAFKTTVTHKSKPTDLYWNSHFATQNTARNEGMKLWDMDYASDRIGREQSFALINLGHGNVALRAMAGAYAGQYLGGMNGGWYPQQFGLGSGSVLSSANPVSLTVHGDQLSILLITRSGFQLNLSHRDLQGIDLSGADMKECDLSGADLSRVAGWDKADFSYATLREAKLDGRSLAGVNWSNADFSGSKWSDSTSAQEAELHGARFDQSDLSGVNFRKALLSGVSFKGARLDHADFSDADLSGADFTGASLVKTNLSGANLQGTHFDHTDLGQTDFGTQPRFTRASSNRTTFVQSTVPFAVLARNWSYLDLTDARILDIPRDLSGLMADGVLLPRGLDLSGRNLTQASFTGARMYEIKLQKATLRSANLRHALLRGARLNYADLTLANLDSAFLIAEDRAALLSESPTKFEAAIVANAYMFNTTLDAAHCDGVDFSGALFVTADSIDPSRRASAIGASMNFAKFNGASVVLAAFNGAQLSAANFSNAVMVGTTFLNNGTTPAQLTPSSDDSHTDATVYQADIRGVDFTGANMDGLDMGGAAFSTEPSTCQLTYTIPNDDPIIVVVAYGVTKLGNTTSNTICPNGQNGPCSLATEKAASAQSMAR